MHGQAFIGSPGSVGPVFAALEHTSGGIICRYTEAVKRRRKNPSPLGNLDMSYFAAIFEMIAAQMDSGGAEWEDEKKKNRLESIKNILKSAKAPTEDKYSDIWITEDRTIFCQKLEDVPEAIHKAYEAYLGVLSIQKDGDTVFPGGIGLAI